MDKASKSLTKRLARVGITVAIVAVVLATVLLITLNSLRVSFFSISGNSMEPTLYDRDSIILKQKKKVEADLLVFFTKPYSWTYTDAFGHEPNVLVKRIAAVPGDRLTYDGKDFFVNGESVFNLAENRYSCPEGPEAYSHKLTSDEIFVLGDNAHASLDSRRVFCDGEKDFFVPSSQVLDFGTIAFKF